MNPNQAVKNKFHLKTFMNKLSTLDKMFNRYLTTYNNSICFEYKSIFETNTYGFTCSSCQKQTIAKLHNILIKVIFLFSLTDQIKQLTENFLRLSNFFKIG